MAKAKSKREPLAPRLVRMRKLMDDIDSLFTKIKPLDMEVNRLREDILNEFTADELSSLTAGGLRVSRVTTVVPTITDQMAFFTFATKKANWDLLQKTVSSPAWRERLQAKKPVPGVGPFNRVSLKVERVKS